MSEYFSGSSGEVKLLEVLEGDGAGAALVALGDEVHDIGVGGREGQVLGEDRLDLLVGDEGTVTFVEKTEALFGLFFLSGLRTEALVPMVGNDMLHKLEVDTVAIEDARVTLFEFFLDVARVHLVEAEVLQDVPEEVVRDRVLVLFTVVLEAVLQVSGHLGRQVADVDPFGCNCTFLLLLGCSSLFLRWHLYGFFAP